jgi:hypothetical protein
MKLTNAFCALAPNNFKISLINNSDSIIPVIVFISVGNITTNPLPSLISVLLITLLIKIHSFLVF